MSIRVYISSDYSDDNGDRDVVDVLNKWGTDNLHKVNFVDMAKVVSGSISKDNPDCRFCDLKQEFNRQINASSAAIFIVGDKTSHRTAGSSCERVSKEKIHCSCTPYKQNAKGKKACKVSSTSTPPQDGDFGNINPYSFLRHEFEQAKRRKRKIIIFYNSLRKESSWLPPYMKDYEAVAVPFWTKNILGQKVGNYDYLKQELGI